MSGIEITWVFVISMTIGALVGGLTNFMAIRMLFRPFCRWRLGKWKVPFTPGLIPKRRDELAHQLGELVEQHLFTPEGMQHLLVEGRLSQQLTARISRQIVQLADSGKTVEELINMVIRRFNLPPEITASETWMKQWEEWMARVWEEQADRSLDQVLGKDGITQLHRYLPVVASCLLEQGANYLESVSGRRLLKQALQEVSASATGTNKMLGALTNLFLDEERILTWSLPRLQEWLQRREVQAGLEQWLRAQLDSMGQRTLRECWQSLEAFGVQEEDAQVSKILGNVVSRILQIEARREMSFHALLEPVWEPLFNRWLPYVMQQFEAELARNVSSLFGFFHVSEVVEREVLNFPLPYLEQVILRVASREFRMITWLGTLIGALVGLAQGLWLYFWMG